MTPEKKKAYRMTGSGKNRLSRAAGITRIRVNGIPDVGYNWGVEYSRDLRYHLFAGISCTRTTLKVTDRIMGVHSAYNPLLSRFSPGIKVGVIKERIFSDDTFGFKAGFGLEWGFSSYWKSRWRISFMHPFGRTGNSTPDVYLGEIG